VDRNKEARLHWIYVLGGRDLRAEARRWQLAKKAAGKSYAVVAARLDETPSGKLKRVASEDVLYLYACPTGSTPGAVGQSAKRPADLAALLRAEGLNRNHRDLKLFISHSGDIVSGVPTAVSYAEQLHNSMKDTYQNLVVYGYLGEVSPRGFYAHKSAGLEPGEAVERMAGESWQARRLRAKDNRVRFPAESAK